VDEAVHADFVTLSDDGHQGPGSINAATAWCKKVAFAS
jgi:hypothetical protein